MYTSPEVASAFEAFWQNKNGLQDRFLNYWSVVANRFKDSEFVLGYDIINEPFAANLQKDSMMFFDQQKFDREFLAPFYERAVEVIRKEDDNHFVFFEPA
jgi:endoglycosylceramidase